MRLLKYIKEDQFDEVQTQVVQDFIKVISKSEYSESLRFVKKQLDKLTSPIAFESHWSRCFFYRGISANTSIIEKTPRTDRKPKDSHIKLSTWVDDAFESKFNWRPRSNGVFATGAYDVAEGYGSAVYMFFPSNGFKFIWSPETSDVYKDLGFMDFVDPKTPSVGARMRRNWENNYTNEYETFDDYLDDYENSWKNKIEDAVKDYKSTDLETAKESGHEIMFKCNKYCALIFEHYIGGSVGFLLAKHIRYEL